MRRGGGSCRLRTFDMLQIRDSVTKGKDCGGRERRVVMVVERSCYITSHTTESPTSCPSAPPQYLLLPQKTAFKQLFCYRSGFSAFKVLSVINLGKVTLCMTQVSEKQTTKRRICEGGKKPPKIVYIWFWCVVSGKPREDPTMSHVCTVGHTIPPQLMNGTRVALGNIE